MRELISNAADAIDKIRHQALTDESALATDPVLQISIIPDEQAGTLTIMDNGIGMTKQELQTNLGTIAHSGTKAFMDAMKQGKADASLIGQFGVGFYSAFLVASRVSVFSKSNSEDKIHMWASDAGGSYTIEEAEYPGLRRGSAVVLHLKDDEKDLLSPARLREIVKRHSEFVQHPIRIWEPIAPPPTPPTLQAGDAEGAVKVEDIGLEETSPPSPPIPGWSALNEQPPIWMMPPSELTDKDYTKFYKSLTNSWSEHLAVKHFEVEGQIGMKGILYVPKEAPFDVFDQLSKSRGLRLYVRRVFVMDHCDDLCPEWLGFLRGVIDSDDLPLNVSREMLQQSTRMMRLLRKQVVRKAIEMLNELANDEAKYALFYEGFSKNLKLGVYEDDANRAKVAELLRFHSSKSGEQLMSLSQYTDRMVEGQKDIFYIAAESVDAARESPFMEAFQKRGIEVST